MRIAYLGSRHILSGYSGIERMLMSMLPYLAGRGHEISVFSGPHPDQQRPTEELWSNIRLVPVPALAGKHTETLSRTVLSLVRVMREQFDVVHFTHEGPGVFSMITRAASMPSVVTVCGLDWQRSKWNRAARILIRRAEWVSTKAADRIVVLSPAIQRYFLTTYGLETDYIPNGTIERPPASWSGRLDRFDLNPNKYVLFAARLVPEKGCHDLVAAWSRFSSDMTLVIAGTARSGDAYAESLRKQAEGLRVVFTGHLQGADLDELFGHAYLFVLPSYVEGQSLALLEAIGHGRATLVSDIAENLVVTDGLGFSFRCGDVMDLRAKLSMLMQTPDIVHAAEEQAKSMVHKLPSWEDVALLHEDVYATVGRQRRGRLR
jgi:glycosyltransferase involved in cell wall biosynthesis